MKITSSISFGALSKTSGTTPVSRNSDEIFAIENPIDESKIPRKYFFRIKYCV